jgi:hypothetical protein
MPSAFFYRAIKKPYLPKIFLTGALAKYFKNRAAARGCLALVKTAAG